MKTSGLEQIESGSVALLGLPWDAMSSFLRGPARAPARIRDALSCPSSNLSTESCRDLGTERRFIDLGDLELPADPSALDRIERAAAAVLERNARFIGLGGDHAVTLGTLRACAERHPKLSVLHFDAHPDLYDELDGNRHSHACPFARALEEGLIGRLVQVGIRTLNPHQREQAERFGVEIVPAQALDAAASLRFAGPLYISVDLDALDPAFAPGVSHPEPGGLSTRQLLDIIQKVEARIISADVVELNPERDLHDLTARVAAKLVKELADRML